MLKKLKIWAQEHPQEFKRFSKFLLVGTIGAIVDFGFFNLLFEPVKALVSEGGGLYTLLLGIGIHASQELGRPLAASLSFFLAVISNFLWNRYWVYPDSRSKPLLRQFALFFLINLAGIVIRVPILRYMHKPFSSLIVFVLPAFDPQAADRLGSNLALAMAVGIVLFWNFFINRVWTYNDVDKD
jgi:putative flippase GtrA